MVAVPEAAAVSVPLDGSWVIADEQGSAQSGFVFDQVWILESDTPVKLCVADIYVPGDVFQVLLNGVPLGETGEPDARFPGAWADTPDQALLDSAFSHATWLIDPGTYTVGVRTLRRPTLFSNEASTLGLSATAQIVSVPEGGRSAGMFGIGLLGLASVARRVRR